MQHPDQKYVDALLNDDKLVLKELYTKYFSRIRLLILQNNGCETDAADIFQDALLAIYHKAKKQEFTITSSFEAFLFVICRNKWIKELKKRKLEGVTFKPNAEYIDIGEDSLKQSEECLLHQERKNLILEKLAQLSEGCKKLLEVSWSGKSMTEVAGTLHVSYAYARKKKSECMRTLVNLVKQSYQYKSLK
jgi:RNA polymerase sigma factor (sigma-70 family)